MIRAITRRTLTFATALIVAAGGLAIVASPARAVEGSGNYQNATIADAMLKHVGSWGGEVCRDAGKLDNGNTGTTVGGYNGGECRTAVNCAVFAASGGAQYPVGGGGDYFAGFINAGGVEITNAADLVKGDIVQKYVSVNDLHTYVIVGKTNTGLFDVVDSNYSFDHKIRRRTTGITLSGTVRAFRMAKVTVSPSSTVIDLKKTVDNGGYQQVYTATSSRVRETWWGDGNGVHTSEIIHIAQNNIRAVDKIVQPDGTQSLYTAVADGIWETWWRPNEGVHHNKIITLPNVKDVIAASKYENGEYVHLLYVLAADGPYEYWWKDNGQGIGHSRLAHIIDPVAFVKAKDPGGVDQIYTATAGAVWETWWNPGQAPQTSSIIGISQNDIVDVDKHNLPNGTQVLYTAVSTGVWESKWGGGLNLSHNKIVVNQNGVKRVIKRMDGTTNQLYMATGSHVQEYWWHATNSGGSTMIGISQNNIRAIERSSYAGVQQLYTAAGATVWETWWGGGSNPGTNALVTVD